MVFAVIIYWALPFSAPFQEVVLIQYVFTMIGVSISLLVGAVAAVSSPDIFFCFNTIYCVANKIAGNIFFDLQNPDAAKEFIPLLITPQILFAGFFVSVENIPVWLRWINKVMPTTYVWRLYLSAEFTTCLDEDAAPSFTRTFCRDYLESQHATGDDNMKYWLILLAMFVASRVLALWFLHQHSKKS